MGVVKLCYIVPIALGGSCDKDNLILGSPVCNRQQGEENMRSL
jgi:hypothetical protein